MAKCSAVRGISNPMFVHTKSSVATLDAPIEIFQGAILLETTYFRHRQRWTLDCQADQKTLTGITLDGCVFEKSEELVDAKWISSYNAYKQFEHYLAPAMVKKLQKDNV